MFWNDSWRVAPPQDGTRVIAITEDHKEIFLLELRNNERGFPMWFISYSESDVCEPEDFKKYFSMWVIPPPGSLFSESRIARYAEHPDLVAERLKREAMEKQKISWEWLPAHPHRH